MATYRKAFVSVRNNTSEPIYAVGVAHKYSDNYKNDGEWGIIEPHELAKQTMIAEYHTGAFTTGRDWWLIFWVSHDGKTLYYSNPNNFRDIIDWMENLGPDVISAIAGAAAGLIAAPSGPATIVAAGAAALASKAITSAVLNSESTAGFKQHILRAEDEDKLTEIIINEDHTITLKSESGSSDTVTSSRSLE